jgi:hypothetical protein
LKRFRGEEVTMADTKVIVTVGLLGGLVYLFTRPQGVQAAEFPRGDVNGDGYVTVSDYILADRIVKGETNPDTGMPYPNEWIIRADVNGDGFVTAADTQTIEDIILEVI